MISLSIFLKIFLPIFIVVIYPGPCVLSYGNIAMNYGYKKGYICVFGCLTAEILYWFIGIFALNTAQSLLPPMFVNMVAIFAGLFLLYIAYDFLRTDTSHLDLNSSKNNLLALYFKFLLLTLANPIAIVGYAGIYIAIEDIKNYIFTVILASAIASIIAHSIIVLSAGTFGKLLLKNKTSGAKALRVINVISALCISGYSLIEILVPTIKKIIIN